MDEAPQYEHQCYVCDKVFSANSNLNRHLRKIHQENVQSPYNNIKCALCESAFPSSSIYNRHLEKDHEIEIVVEHLTFDTRQAFDEWKHGVENGTTSQFIKSRGEKKTKDVNKTYYSCNRSGYYVSKARTQKALKKQGSRKINGRCPASMNVTLNTDSTLDVRFVKTHVGHGFELRHLDLSNKDRDLIVQKLAAGITKKDIIKQIRSATDQQLTASLSTRSSVSGNSTAPGTIQPVVISDRRCIISTPADKNHQSSGSSSVVGADETPDQSVYLNDSSRLSRLHLATTKDIHNILNSKHLDSKKIRHNYDLNNLEAWVNESKELAHIEGDSSLLYYKEQGKLDDKFPRLRQDDFVLVVMKDGQAKILKEFGDKCIVIDSTHTVHCEYLHLAYVSVVDEERRSFPVAFLFSTRTDIEVLEVFFRLIKEKVGTISTKMFIADELHDFYQAWWRVMSMPIHNLLTPWCVLDAWTRRFDTIKSREKLRKLRRNLRSLLTETETERFSRSLNSLLKDYQADQDVREFLAFFEENYSRNSEVWSNCLRKNYGVSNFQLNGLHEKFKMVYKEGKNSKKMCKYVASLMNLFDDHQLDRLIDLEGRDPAKQQRLLESRHQKGIETISLVYEVAVEPVYWLCPSDSSNDVYFEVKQQNQNSRRLMNGGRSSSPRASGADLPLPSTKRFNRGSVKEPRECCEAKCVSCDSCRHAYKCTCLDYLVNLNMCKHIHRICTLCREEIKAD